MQDPLKPVEEKPQSSEDRAEALLREANLCRVRGDANRARDLLDEAEKLAPESSAVFEARGDYFAEQGMFRKATECFAMAMELNPNQVGLEKKHAESVYAQHTGEWAVEQALSGGGQYITANGASLFSLFVPGLGQFLLGHVGRGVTLFLIVALSWVIALLIPNGLSEIGQLFGKGGSNFNALVLLPLFLAVAAHIGAIADAGALAKRNKFEKVDRPAPLVDKDFEI